MFGWVGIVKKLSFANSRKLIIMQSTPSKIIWLLCFMSAIYVLQFWLPLECFAIEKYMVDLEYACIGSVM